MIAWTPQIQYDQHDYHICYNHHLNHNPCQDPYMIYYHSHNQFQNHDQGHIGESITRWVQVHLAYWLTKPIPNSDKNHPPAHHRHLTFRLQNLALTFPNHYKSYTEYCNSNIICLLNKQYLLKLRSLIWYFK